MTEFRMFLLIGIICVFSTDAIAQTKPSEPKFGTDADSFRGLQHIGVLVEKLRHQEQAGLSDATLKTSVELKLRQNGINVPNDGDPGYSLFPYIYVNVNLMSVYEGRSFIYAIDVEFRRHLQAYIPTTKETVYVDASPWDRATLGITSAREASSTIREAVNDLLDAFLNVYLSVNPKK